MGVGGELGGAATAAGRCGGGGGGGEEAVGGRRRRRQSQRRELRGRRWRMRWQGGWCRQTMVAAAREENRVARVSGGEGGDSDEVEARRRIKWLQAGRGRRWRGWWRGKVWWWWQQRHRWCRLGWGWRGLGPGCWQRHRVSGRPAHDEALIDDVAEPAPDPDALEGSGGVVATVITALALLCTRHVCVALLCQRVRCRRR